MARTWVLDTETKGTGARMVPIESVKKRSATVEPVLVARKSASAPTAPTPEPRPRPPHKFRIVDLMTRQTLIDGASARQAVDELAKVRSVVDVNVYTWDEQRADWQLLTLSETRALWELAGR